MKNYKWKRLVTQNEVCGWLNTMQPEVITINYLGNNEWVVIYTVEEETLKVPDWIKEHNRENY